MTSVSDSAKFLTCVFFIPAVLGVAWPMSADAAERAYDWMIADVTVYDGVSRWAQQADIAIHGGRIAAIGDLNHADTRHLIDGTGLIAAPGFIDAHTHSDFNPRVYPNLPNKVMQGVTTEITGNCGMSAAPVMGRGGEFIRDVWAREGVPIFKPDEAALPWESFEQYQKNMEAEGSQTNLAGLVGHGNVRFAVMGSENRTPAADEQTQMNQILKAALENGAFGISFGLDYLPGMFALEQEITELCRIAGEAGGVCAFHMRHEGSEVDTAVEEVIRIAEKTGARIQISHLKTWAGDEGKEKLQKAFALIEAARKRGFGVMADVYPYEAGYAELGVILPDRYYQDPNRQALLENPESRGEIIKALKEAYAGRVKKWDQVVIGAVADSAHQKYEGRSIAEAAAETGAEPEAFVVDFLAATQFKVSAFYFSQNPSAVEAVILKPYAVIGSDSIADGSRYPHPRNYGTFPKILRQWVVDEKKINWADVFEKLSSRVAEHFQIAGRGSLQAGYYADIVVLDPARIEAAADYDSPKKLSAGIEWVFVNGNPVVSKGLQTLEKPGRMLSRAEI